jgi:hypothetical protein
MAYTCHLCADAEQATVLITPLQGGDTMAIGPNCMVTGLCGLLSVATQTDAEQLYDAIITLRQAQDDAAAAAAKASAGSGAKPPSSPRQRQSRARPPAVPQSAAESAPA